MVIVGPQLHLPVAKHHQQLHHELRREEVCLAGFHQEADEKKQAEVIEASLSDLDDSSFLNGSDFESKESPNTSPQPNKQS